MCGEGAFLAVEHPGDDQARSRVHLFPLLVMILFNFLAFGLSINFWFVQGQQHDSLDVLQGTAVSPVGSEIDIHCPLDVASKMNSCLLDVGCKDTHTLPCKEYFDLHCQLKARLSPGFRLLAPGEEQDGSSSDSEFTLTILVLVSFLAMVAAFAPPMLSGSCDRD